MLFRILLIILFVSCSSQEREDIVIDDFENGNYKNWNLQGSSFLKPVHKDSLKHEIKNIHGKYVAYSFFDNDSLDWSQGKNQGKLVSNPFTINRNFIQFLIAGGVNETRSCINLIINNEVVKFAAGKADYELRPVSWDVKNFIGETGTLEIVDAMGVVNTVEGYTLVDHIVFTDYLHKKEFVFEDFESGTFNNWKVEGDAFEIPRNRTNVYYPLSANGFNGDYFAFSFADTHDVKQGKLTSREFVIAHDYIKLLVGGGAHKLRTCTNLIINDSVVLSATGINDGQMRRQRWDVRAFKGQKATIEIVDNYSGSWGHTMVDDIIFYDGLPIYQQSLFWIAALLVLVLLFALFKVYMHKKNDSLAKDSNLEGLDELEDLKLKLQNSNIFKEYNVSIEQIVELSGIEEEEVNYLFENIGGTTIGDFLNLLRVEEFKKQLKDPLNEAYTMVSIAENCGFSSKTSFYRVFKSVTKMTPSEYKKSIL